MTKLTFSTTRSLNEGRVVEFIRQAKDALGLGELTLTPVTANPDISFGVGGRVELPLPSDVTYEQVYAALRTLTRLNQPWDKTLFFDIETHNAGKKRWDMPRNEFVRLIQYSWGDKVYLTTDIDEFLNEVSKADGLVAHFGHMFDFSVMFGDEALEMAYERRLFDTAVFANLAFPAPDLFTDRTGRKHTMYMGGTPKVVPHSQKWLSLDNLAYQLGCAGKSESLQELAKRHNPPKTPVRDLDYGLIPVDDPEFLYYAEQDVVALIQVTHNLLIKQTPTEYDWYEQFNSAMDAQMSRNGFTIDVPLAQERIRQAEERKQALLENLQENYGFPKTESKAPWSTNEGKKAIIQAIRAQGVDPTKSPWPQGKTGPSLGGDILKKYCPDKEFAENLALLKGDRGLAQQALDAMCADGMVHIDVTALQRSGRKSISNPSLGTWSARGKKAVEKEYFVARPGHSIVELDLSNADARGVAAMSGDPAYMERVNLSDPHEVTGRAVFGDETYDSNPEHYRQQSKIGSLGWGYRMRAGKLSVQLNVPFETAKRFVDWMDDTYRVVVAWQSRMTHLGERDGTITNAWGRKMIIDTDPETGSSRAYTQAPALMGQSSTREILQSGLIRLYERDRRFLSWLKATIHDAVVLEIPDTELDWAVPTLIECLEFQWNGVEFPVAAGKPAKDWFRANH